MADDVKDAAGESFWSKIGMDRKANMEKAKKKREAMKGKDVSIRGTKIPQNNDDNQ